MRLLTNGQKLLTTRRPLIAPQIGYFKKGTLDAASRLWKDTSPSLIDAPFVGTPTIVADGFRTEGNHSGLDLPNTNGRFSTDGNSYSVDFYLTYDQPKTEWIHLFGRITDVSENHGILIRNQQTTNGTATQRYLSGWAFCTRVRIYANGVLINDVTNATAGSKKSIGCWIDVAKPIHLHFSFEGLYAQVTDPLYPTGLMTVKSYDAYHKGMIGTLHGFTIYDRVLTDAEVKQNYEHWTLPKPLQSLSKQPYAIRGTGNAADKAKAQNFTWALNQHDSFSIEAWMKINTFINYDFGVLIQGATSADDVMIVTGGSGDKMIQFQFGTTGALRTGAGSLTEGKWFHVVGTYSSDGVNTVQRLYLDGVLRQESFNGLKPTTATRTNLQLNLKGANDQALSRIWNKALTDAEVKEVATKIYQPGDAMFADIRGQYLPQQGRVYDLSNTPVNFVLEGSTKLVPSTAPVGQRSSLMLDGMDDYFRFPAAIPAGSAITIEFWFIPKVTGAASLFGNILEGGTAAHTHRCQAHAPYNDNILYWDYGSDTGGVSSANRISYNISAHLNKWTHVALVSSGSANTFQGIYINGELVAQKTTSRGVSINISHLELGRFIGNSTWYQKATVGLFRVFTAVRTQAEIAANMFKLLPAATANLLEQFSLREGLGTTIYGTKGANGIGTGAPAWQTPSIMNWRNRVAKFNGADTIIDLGNPEHLKVTGDTTIEMWINPISSTGRRCLIDHAYGGLGTVVLEPDGTLNYYYGTSGNDASPATGISSTVGIVPNGTWTHIAVTRNTETGEMIWYKNGVKDVSKITSFRKAVAGAHNWVIGLGYTNTRYGGLMDELRMWRSVRSPQEIADNYQRSIDRHPDLVLNYNFDSDLWEASGHGTHGTVAGTLAFEESNNDKLLFNAPIND